ncbi:hypothetical protein SADUNF_Sadunf06G0157400 [Salix dunnii]|uniref:Uncharacterized protein n=1 Tax=Salix dunnii TaxID=1413687 RepID=A0A835N349_9ROSI|nr:hypothetical protein SADUNF_Sadunf06G0157400 [Salix dunnii]
MNHNRAFLSLFNVFHELVFVGSQSSDLPTKLTLNYQLRNLIKYKNILKNREIHTHRLQTNREEMMTKSHTST